METTRLKLLILFLAFAATTPVHGLTWPDPPAIEKFAEDMQARHGFDAAKLSASLHAIQPNPMVLQAIAPPTDPNVKSWQRYRARFINEARIRNGLAFWKTHARTLARAEADYGVPAGIIVAIIGVETEYGKNPGRFEVFEALATLAFAYPRRADYFRGELEEFLLLARENDLPLRGVRGSFAGAIGIPQFMPGSHRKFAVDFDGNGKIDLRGSTVDAIGSVARFLKLHGWKTGEPITARIADTGSVLPDWSAAGLKPTLEEAFIIGANVAPNSRPGRYPAALIDLASPETATEYWWGYENFYVITRYNRSSFYAMSVAHLAEAIAHERSGPKGKRPVKADYPAPHRRAG